VLSRFVQAIAHRVLVVDPELQTYVPGATVVARALDEDSWSYVGPVSQDEPLVVHAPSRRGIKGTPLVLEAVEKLRAQGLRFRFQLVEGLPHAEAKRVYEAADILVDQLHIGWYGVLAVEGMALGKAVISYVRPDLWRAAQDRPPILNATPESITQVLRTSVLDCGLRAQLAPAARAFFMRTHASRAVAAVLKDLYEAAMHDDSPPDLEAVAAFLDHQNSFAAAAAGATAAHWTARSVAHRSLRDRLDKAGRILRQRGTRALLDHTQRFLLHRLRRRSAR
jgi:hypothetical protein